MNPMLRAWTEVIARDGWAAARLDAVAAVAAVDAGRIAETLPDRWTAVSAFVRHVETAALAEAGDSGTVRDRLFAMIMAGFDAAQDARTAATTVAAAWPGDPALAVFLGLNLSRSLGRLAEAAGISGGFGGIVRTQALGLLCLAVARVWLSDESADLGATMKELDTRLAQAESWVRRLPHRAPPAATPPDLLALPAATPRPAADPPVG